MILNKYFDYISRWWQGHGFGIESKTDFAFLHNVILEKTPYYAYEEWDRLFPDTLPNDKRRARLLLRLCNYIQPKTVHIYGNIPQLFITATNNGCGKATTEHHATNFLRLQSINTSAKLNTGTLLEMIPQHHAPNDACYAIMLTDINCGNQALWNDITCANTITYDMRDIGIAIIRHNRYPEHYKI